MAEPMAVAKEISSVVHLAVRREPSWAGKLASSMVESMAVFSDEMMAECWDGLSAGMMVASVVERSVK